MTMELYCWSGNGDDSFTTGFLLTSQRFSLYGERLSRELKNLDVCVYGFKGLTTLQLSKNEDARLIAHLAFRHGQEFRSVLDDQRPFDLLLIMQGRTSWSFFWLLS